MNVRCNDKHVEEVRLWVWWYIGYVCKVKDMSSSGGLEKGIKSIQSRKKTQKLTSIAIKEGENHLYLFRD